MKLWSLPTFQSLKTFEDLRRFVTQSTQNFYQILSKNVGFTENINCQIFEDVTILAGQSLVIDHKLGVVPIGFFVIKTNQPASLLIPTSGFTWTTTQVSLAATDSGTSTIILLGS